MIVPTGKARVATRISGPSTFCGMAAACACGAAAELNMLLARNAVPPATIKATIYNITFFASMMRNPLVCRHYE